MSIFGSIMSAIVGVAKSAGSAITSAASAATGTPAAPQEMSQVDVEAGMTKLASESKESSIGGGRLLT